MQPYLERARQVASESHCAVQVFLSRDNDDIEFVPLRPRYAWHISPEEFNSRRLRPVAVIGLNGLKPMSAFKEPLEPFVVAAMAAAFLEYTCVLLGDSLAEQTETAEIAELGRLFALKDHRTN